MGERYKGACDCGDHHWAVMTKGFVTMVSPEDASVLASRPWHALVASTRCIYATHGLWQQPKHLLHKDILAEASIVDHVNRNGLDNRRMNLRVATHSQNMANASRPTPRSGFHGVRKHRQRWSARLSETYLGMFPTAEDAARAYDAAATLRFGPFANLNFKDAAHG